MMKNAIVQKDYLLELSVELPFPGIVKVNPGQSLRAGELIAEAVLPAKFQVFDVLNQFRMDGKEFESSLKRLAGEEVQKGDVIVKKPGLISRIFRAPEAGKLVAIRDGRITLAMGEKTIQAVSPIDGVVGEIIPALGATVVSHGLGIEAAWGNGKTASGNFVMIDQVDKSVQDLENKIVLHNKTATIKEIKKLQKAAALGILVSSLDASRAFGDEQFDLPVASLLGFGKAVLDDFTRSKLEELTGAEVYLVARKTDPLAGIRPILFSPTEDSQTAALFSEPEGSLIGRSVRLLGQLHFGKTGKIITFSEEPEKLASCMEAALVTIETSEGEILRLPFENLEFLSD